MAIQIVGEIGGTSSRWAVLGNDGVERNWPVKGSRLPGYNPLSSDGSGFTEGIRAFLKEHDAEALDAIEVHIYAAGCGAPDRSERMSSAIRAIWPNASCEVRSDLQGAAIGLCGTRSGLVLILGTGMNAGYFDGEHLRTPMPSLGYLLGDEGSGADIGRQLLKENFVGVVPEDVQQVLFGEPGLDLAIVLKQVHGATHPAKELASYTARMAGHLDVPYVRELIISRFHALAELLIRFHTEEQRRVVFATGSVAFGFRELLAEVLMDHGMELVEVAPDPLPGLVIHHRPRQ